MSDDDFIFQCTSSYFNVYSPQIVWFFFLGHTLWVGKFAEFAEVLWTNVFFGACPHDHQHLEELAASWARFTDCSLERWSFSHLNGPSAPWSGWWLGWWVTPQIYHKKSASHQGSKHYSPITMEQWGRFCTQELIGGEGFFIQLITGPKKLRETNNSPANYSHFWNRCEKSLFFWGAVFFGVIFRDSSEVGNLSYSFLWFCFRSPRLLLFRRIPSLHPYASQVYLIRQRIALEALPRTAFLTGRMPQGDWWEFSLPFGWCFVFHK